MKRILLSLCSVMLALSLMACGVGEAPPPASVPAIVSSLSITQEAEGTTEELTDEPISDLMLKLTTEQSETIIFALNGSNAAKSLYEQLPLSLEIANYSDDEKIFYPPEKLDTSDTPPAKGPAGTLAYYAPWGDVAIYYGDCEGASGLYQLGQVVSGTEHISKMSGTIQLEAGNNKLPSSEPEFQESAASSKAPASISEVSSARSVTKPSESTPEPTEPEPIASEPIVPEEDTMRSIQVTVGGKTFSATLAENDAANSFAQLLQSAPVALQMSDYSGFEKVGDLGTSLPESNRQTTTQAGDIVLYNGNQICVFYGSNSWSYTRLGKIDNLSGWAEALGGGDVTVTFGVK